ncbi:MAG: PTS galactitol transporter subunit IIC [Rectinemataceae bacterium]
METLSGFIAFIFSFKAYVMLPGIILVLGLIIRMKPGQAALSALRLGVGFAGIFIVFDFFVKQIAPAVTSMIVTRGLDFPVLDVGWPPLAAITWASPIAPLTIVLVLILNIAMLSLNITKTINIDIWNYWHFALVGALVQSATGSIALGLIVTTLIAFYSIVVADWTAPRVHSECGLKGISITTLSVNGILPYAVAADKLFDLVPGLRKISLSPKGTAQRFGILMDPLVIGASIGVLFGILAAYDIKRVLELAINIAAVMFILPHCGGLIGRAMEPVSLQLKALIQKRFPDKKVLYIGMDSGILMQNSAVIVTGLILMPISIAIAFVLPGNKVLPLGDLANLISVMSVIVLVTRSNVFRAVIIGIPVVISFLLISTHFAPMYTRLSAQAGMVGTASYAGQITAFADGGNPLRFWFFYLFQGNPLALVGVPVVLALMYFAWKRNKKELLE